MIAGAFLPNTAQSARCFERTFGEPPDDGISMVYTVWRSFDRGIFVDSDAPYLLQFSVSSADDARRRLREAGFLRSCGETVSYWNVYSPSDFPLLWLPLTTSPELERWCADRGVAWLDSDELAVYMALSAGWRPPR